MAPRTDNKPPPPPAKQAKPKTKSNFNFKPHSRLRLRSLAHVGAVIAVLLVLHLLDRNGLLLVDRPDLDQYHLATATVTRIVDGDTLIVDLPDPLLDTQTTRIRIWGIDTPELAHASPTPTPAEPFAQQATDFAADLLLNRTVTLRIEKHRIRDRYNRILAHIDLPDESNFAEHLLLQGLAIADDRWIHTLVQRYAQLEHKARQQRLGLWAN